jgi:hypothetical protein
MGSYAECWLESLYVGSTKNDYDPTLIELFRSADKRTKRVAIKELPKPLRGGIDSVDNADEEIDVVYYTSPVLSVRDRLDLKGYTLEAAKLAFNRRIQVEMQRHLEEEVLQGMEEFHQNRARLLATLDADQWLATLRHIKESDIGLPQWATSEFGQESSHEEFMLRNDWYGFPGVDLNIPLRLALEVCAKSDSFIYDLTDLVSAGYFNKDEDFVALASGLVANEHASHSKIIILTEGRSDGWILSESLKLLYPHLCDYFTFMDFESAKVEGGVSHLARIVKSFAGAGIANKVIAVFDNDAAGEDAIRSLRTINLPGNLSVVKLPDLDMLRDYPTIGPSGASCMNINGSAASIELYLGVDVLSENGKLLPIQWSSYNYAVEKYQGEVLEKSKIHQRFKEKLLHQKNSHNLMEDRNWSGMCAIMASIFSAFHDYDKQFILAEQLEDQGRW